MGEPENLTSDATVRSRMAKNLEGKGWQCVECDY